MSNLRQTSKQIDRHLHDESDKQRCFGLSRKACVSSSQRKDSEYPRRFKMRHVSLNEDEDDDFESVPYFCYTHCISNCGHFSVRYLGTASTVLYKNRDVLQS